MPPLFWTGKLSTPMRVLVNLNNLIALITGNARDTAAMKRRTKRGYEGACSDHVTHYDDFGIGHYGRIAEKLIENIEFPGKEVLDAGCGTGIISSLVMNKGAAKLTCGDISEYMLSRSREKLLGRDIQPETVEFRQLDAEHLPFDDKSFDVVVSGMLLGLVPDQSGAVSEMARVVRTGGTVALSTHGPECWWEAADACFRAIPKRYTIGYRIEYWPLTESALQALFVKAGLVNVRTFKLLWQDHFETGSEAYDFFASASASWWNAKFPPDKVEEISRMTRDYLVKHKVLQITHDIIFAYGCKP